MYDKMVLVPSAIFLYSLLLSSTYARDIRSCEPRTSCLELRGCPEVIELARSIDFNDRRRYRESICRFDQQVFVCCPVASTPPPPNIFFPSTNPRPSPTSGEGLLPIAPNCGTQFTEDRIHGGEPTSIGSYPWVVAIGYKEIGLPGIKYDCAGSLINNRYVVTAAHCVDPEEINFRIISVIRVGDWDLSTDEDCQARKSRVKCYGPHVEVGVEETVVHPDFNRRALTSDDIALIRLDRAIDMDNRATAPIQPICLPPETHSTVRDANGRKAIATGWGLTQHGNRSEILLSVKIPFANDQLCRDTYKRQFVSNQLCVGGIRGKDTCNGDSGGPLVMAGTNGPPYQLIGIVSYGAFPCALKETPGIYTDVVAYRKWIIENIRK